MAWFSPSITVVANKHQIRELDTVLAGIRNGVPRVIVRSINKVGRSARTEAARIVVKKTGFKKSEVDKFNVRLKPANFKSFIATVVLKGGNIPIVRLKAREIGRGKRKRGVKYKWDGQWKTEPHAFFADVVGSPKKFSGRYARQSNRQKIAILQKRGMSDEDITKRTHTGVFVRKGASRLPIAEVKAPNLMRAFEPYLPSIMAHAQSRLMREITTQTELVLKSAGKTVPSG